MKDISIMENGKYIENKLDEDSNVILIMEYFGWILEYNITALNEKLAENDVRFFKTSHDYFYFVVTTVKQYGDKMPIFGVNIYKK